MPNPKRPLRHCLRALVLGTPLLIAGCSDEGLLCGPTNSSPSTEVWVFALTSPDGGDVLDVDAQADCFTACNALVGQSQGCFFEELDSGPGVSCTWQVEEEDPPSCGLGRRPASLCVSPARRSAGAVGDYFAQAAGLESAAAHAFGILARELAAHAAPARLVRAARRSIREEVGHARTTRRLARRFGALPVRARYGAVPRGRSLEDIAIENAVEGCVRETYGAALAWWQAEHAQDRRIARTMARVAVEESRHAQLSWDIAAWAEPRLSRAARARLARARAQAFETLRVEVDRHVAPALVSTAGLPPRASARELLRRVEREVISPYADRGSAGFVPS
jgi:hypothetical protein